MVNKSKNFTHITERDYHMLASILAFERRNVGQLIFDEIVRFRFHASTASPIPYPQLISFFLQKNHIWYLEPNDHICRINSFGLTQLNRMRIEIPSGAFKKDRAQKRMKKPEIPREEQEVQSSFKSETTPPSFFGASIQNYMEEGFKKVVEELKVRQDQSMKALVETLDEFCGRFSQIQTQTLQEISSLRQDVNYLQEIFLAHISTQIPSPPSIPSHSPSHSHLSPQPLAPSPQPTDHSPTHTELVSSNLSEPDSIHTQIISPLAATPELPPSSISVPPPTPPTEVLPSPSDSNFLFSLPDPTSSQPVHITLSPSPLVSGPPSLSAADKKGEKDKDDKE